MPASKPNVVPGLASTRISHSAEGPLKVSPPTGTTSKLACATAWLNHQARATARPVHSPPSHIQARLPLRQEKYSATASHSAPSTRPSQWPAPTRASRLRALPPSTVHQPAISLRSGARLPASVACAVTANTSPDSRARRLPLADRMSRRLAQPRVITMPTPNSRPPTSAPDRLPRLASWRTPLTSSQPARIKPCTAISAVANASSQTESFSANLPRQNSITAARRQNRERWAKKPNSRPITAPPTESTPAVPCRSTKVAKSMVIFDNQLALTNKRGRHHATNTEPTPDFARLRLPGPGWHARRPLGGLCPGG